MQYCTKYNIYTYIWVIKEFSELLAVPVAAIYNSSLREGHVPRIWRAAYVSHLPKKKPPEHIETDLRPISLTAVLCKQMEECVVISVWDIVQDRVDPNQYGSIKKSSTHMPSLTCYISVI